MCTTQSCALEWTRPLWRANVRAPLMWLHCLDSHGVFLFVRYAIVVFIMLLLQCGAFKINCAVDKLPNFECYPSSPDGLPGPQHRGTAHFENRMEEIEFAYREASMGMPASRPVIEMTIPSALDSTIAPPGTSDLLSFHCNHHVFSSRTEDVVFVCVLSSAIFNALMSFDVVPIPRYSTIVVLSHQSNRNTILSFPLTLYSSIAC